MVSGAFILAAKYGNSLPAIHGVHEAWRYTLISGVIPAIPLIIIRPFLPESPMWKEKKAAGTLKRPSIMEIFNPRFKRTTLITTLMVACSFAVAFGAIQQVPQIVPGVPEVRQMVENRLQACRRVRPSREAARRAAEPYVGLCSSFKRWAGWWGASCWLFSPCVYYRAEGLSRLFQIPGLIIVPARLSSSRPRPALRCSVGHLLRGAIDRSAIQLLGELPAESLPDAPARHGRKLFGKRRRANDRDLGGVADHAIADATCRARARRQSSLTRLRAWPS